MTRHARITTAKANDARTELQRAIRALVIAEGSGIDTGPAQADVDDALAEFEKAVRADVPAPLLRRFWVNQPSTLQADHARNGMNVLAAENDDDPHGVTTVYFTSGEAVSARMPKLALSPGWRPGS